MKDYYLMYSSIEKTKKDFEIDSTVHESIKCMSENNIEQITEIHEELFLSIVYDYYMNDPFFVDSARYFSEYLLRTDIKQTYNIEDKNHVTITANGISIGTLYTKLDYKFEDNTASYRMLYQARNYNGEILTISDKVKEIAPRVRERIKSDIIQ